MMSEYRNDDYWFVPRQYGFGATPVTWQGWALYATAVAIIILDTKLVETGLTQQTIAIATLVLTIAISAHKTRGGWRWRWGSRD